MRCVCLAPFVPYDGIEHAGGVYLHAHLSQLSRTCDLVLLAPDVRENRRAVMRAGERPYTIQLMPRPFWRKVLDRPALYYRRVFRSLADGYCPIWLNRDARRVIQQADVLEVQWAAYLPLVPALRRLNSRSVISVVVHEVETQRRRRIVEAANGVLARGRAAISFRLVKSLEARYLRLCDVLVAFKVADLRFAAGVGGPVRGVLVQPRVVVPERPPPVSSDHKVLFVGALSRLENSDGVRWLLDEVWTKVADAVPSALLIVAGANPPEWLLARASERVEVPGYVENLSALYGSARVVVAPIQLGGGIKFKIAEALAHGRAVIALPEAAEGYESVPAGCLNVSSEATGFSDAIIRYLIDEKLAREAAVRAWEWAVEELDFSKSIERLVANYERTVADRSVGSARPRS